MIFKRKWLPNDGLWLISVYEKEKKKRKFQVKTVWTLFADNLFFVNKKDKYNF